MHPTLKTSFIFLKTCVDNLSNSYMRAMDHIVQLCSTSYSNKQVFMSKTIAFAYKKEQEVVLRKTKII